MADLLQLMGYRVRAVYDGLQAVEEARLLQPRVVIMDIDMPVMDGYAAAAAIRCDRSGGVVLIAHTASLLASIGANPARLASFDYCVFKPIDSNRLCALVASSVAAVEAR